jgi:hypothetical protein
MVSSQVVVGLEWTFLAIAYISVAARIYVRLGIRKDRILWSDGWLLVALASVQGLVICDIITYRRHDLNNFDPNQEAVLKIRFATNYLFDFGIYFPKFSILALYYLLVPQSRSSMRLFLYALTVLTVSSSVFTLFADTFWCGGNPAVNWSVLPVLLESVPPKH